MERTDTVIAVFAYHRPAKAALKNLIDAGFKMKNLTFVTMGYHTEEKVVGFYNAGDRIRSWSMRGSLWGGLWGLFFGGSFSAAPVMGGVIVLGPLAMIAFSAIEGAVLVGGLSALGAALYSIRVSKNSMLKYAAAVKADGFLVMAHCAEDEAAWAEGILHTAGPSCLDVHSNARPPEREGFPALAFG